MIGIWYYFFKRLLELLFLFFHHKILTNITNRRCFLFWANHDHEDSILIFCFLPFCRLIAGLPFLVVGLPFLHYPEMASTGTTCKVYSSRDPINFRVVGFKPQLT